MNPETRPRGCCVPWWELLFGEAIVREMMGPRKRLVNQNQHYHIEL